MVEPTGQGGALNRATNGWLVADITGELPLTLDVITKVSAVVADAVDEASCATT
ncbi:MAG TPA: hypothetical protein VMF91_00445 [Bryobacteraceae bacterium]|nr:hypothetical protein [Bryobacteraceae bacterium]